MDFQDHTAPHNHRIPQELAQLGTPPDLLPQLGTLLDLLRQLGTPPDLLPQLGTPPDLLPQLGTPPDLLPQLGTPLDLLPLLIIPQVPPVHRTPLVLRPIPPEVGIPLNTGLGPPPHNRYLEATR